PSKNAEADNDLLFLFPQKLREQTRCCNEATKSSDSCDEIRTHRRRSINTPAIAPSPMKTQCVMKRARLMRLTFWPNRRNSATRSAAWWMNAFERRSSNSTVPRKSSKLGG